MTAVTMPAISQTYPTFTVGAKNQNTIHRSSATQGASPTPVIDGLNTAVIYADPSTGDLDYAVSSNDYNLSYPPSGSGIYIGIDNTPAAANLNGTLWVAFVLNNVLYTTSSTNHGQTWTGPISTPTSYTPSGRPSMASTGTSLVLTFRSGSNIVVCTGDGNSFGPEYTIGGSYAATSNPSVTPYHGGTALTYLTNNGYPVVAIFPSNNPVVPSTVTETTGVMLGGDPAPIAYNGGLFIFGRSYYSADNLWAIGTTDGVTFEQQQKYGQTLTNSPGMIVNAGGSLSQFGRSNYGSNIWGYRATY